MIQAEYSKTVETSTKLENVTPGCADCDEYHQPCSHACMHSFCCHKCMMPSCKLGRSGWPARAYAALKGCHNSALTSVTIRKTAQAITMARVASWLLGWCSTHLTGCCSAGCDGVACCAAVKGRPGMIPACMYRPVAAGRTSEVGTQQPVHRKYKDFSRTTQHHSAISTKRLLKLQFLVPQYRAKVVARLLVLVMMMRHACCLRHVIHHISSEGRVVHAASLVNRVHFSAILRADCHIHCRTWNCTCAW